MNGDNKVSLRLDHWEQLLLDWSSRAASRVQRRFIISAPHTFQGLNYSLSGCQWVLLFLNHHKISVSNPNTHNFTFFQLSSIHTYNFFPDYYPRISQD